MSLPYGAKGSSLPTRQADRVGCDPFRGQTRYAVWKCIDQTQVDYLAAQATALQMPYNTSSTGTTITLEIEIVGGSTDPTKIGPPVDRWEMPCNELQKSGWLHPKSLIIGSDPSVISERHLADGKTLRECLDDMLAMTPNPIAAWSPEQYAAHAAVYGECSSGNTHYPVGQHVLRHTTNVSSAYGENVADLNEEMLYSVDQLIAECTNPFYWKLPLPGRLQYKIRNFKPPTVRTGYLWSWRKLPSGEGSSAGGRIEIVTEYWLEQWSLYYFDAVPAS